jgi:hypothetical protein
MAILSTSKIKGGGCMNIIQNEIAILNTNALKGLPMRVGERCVIIEELNNSPNYQYKVRFDDGTTSKVRETELNKLTEKDIDFMEYIFQGNKVEYCPISEVVEVVKVDYIHKTAEIRHDQDGEEQVVLFESLRPVESEVK